MINKGTNLNHNKYMTF